MEVGVSVHLWAKCSTLFSIMQVLSPCLIITTNIWDDILGGWTIDFSSEQHNHVKLQGISLFLSRCLHYLS